MNVKSADEIAIRNVALDYAEGWFDGDVERMDRALHPKLAKRGIEKDLPKGEKRLADLTKDAMIGYTRDGGGVGAPRDKLYYKVDIFDVYEETAIVRVETYTYIDHLQLLKDDGRWSIINVLYTHNRAKKD